jgi:hypothetical protein
MGMGYAACYADTVEESFVKEICPQEFEHLIQALSNKDIDMGEFAQTWRDYSTKEEKTEHFKAYLALCEVFNKKTGLELYLDYHDPADDGDRYDDVDGIIFCVDGVYELTKAGKKHQKQIQRKTWVSLG